MQKASPQARAFTLIEILAVLAIILILTSIAIPLVKHVMEVELRSRTDSLIHGIGAAFETYKSDHGNYPRSDGSAGSAPPNLPTEGVASGGIQGAVPLNPETDGDPRSQAYKNSSLYLYTQLSGDLNFDGKHDAAEPTAYCAFKSSDLAVDSATNHIAFFKDAFGNSFGYSTAAALDNDLFQAALQSGSSNPTRVTAHGFNPTYDLWSTGGRTNAPESSDPNATWSRWIKNW